MELRQLTYFEAVARLGSFTQAAHEVRVAQPAVSAQIRKLERELGPPLLERTTRTVSLTQAGEVALPRVRSILRTVQQLRADLAGLAGAELGEVRLGAATALGALDLPAALASFREQHRWVRLVVRTGYMSDLVDEVSRADLDVAVGPLSADLPPQLAATTIAEESLVLISQAGTDLGQVLPSLYQVHDRPFVCLPIGSGLRTILVAAGRAAGFEPHVTVEAPDPRTLRAYVSAGLGVGLIARSDAMTPGPPVRLIEVSALPAHPPIAAVRQSALPQSAAVRALLLALTAARPGSALP